MRYRLAFLLLLAVAAVGVTQEWIYAARGATYAVIDPATAATVSTGTLAADSFIPDTGETPVIVPTPGGRYVFFVFAGSGVAVVVDAETHQVARAIELPDGTRTLQFSSMGETIYVQKDNGDRLVADHRRGSLQGGWIEAPELDPGILAFNRRATRLYGNRGSDLVYLLVTDGSEIRTVGAGAGYDWSVSPNFRFLLGIEKTAPGDESDLVLVDEQRASVTGRFRDTSGFAFFDSESREVHALDAEGQTIVLLDTRRFRSRSRVPLARRLRAFWLGENGAYHGISPNGEIILDAGGNSTRVEVPGSGQLEAVLFSLKPGQGFACF